MWRTMSFKSHLSVSLFIQTTKSSESNTGYKPILIDLNQPTLDCFVPSIVASCDILLKMRIHCLILIIVAFTVLAAAQQAEPGQLLNSAINAQQRGDFPTAIQDYQAYLKIHPSDVEAEVNLGAAFVHEGQFDEGIAMYKTALPLLTDKIPVLMNIGLAYYKKGDFQSAQQQFAQVNKLRPSDARIAILLGDTDTRLNKAEDAVALLEPLEAENAQNMDFEYVLGSAMIASGRRRDGVARIEKVAQASNSADTYMLAGATWLDLNEFAHASTDFDTALRLNPKLPNIYALAGTAQYKNGDVKDAEVDFREALKIDPNAFDPNLYLGAILYKQRDMDNAKIYLDHAIQIKPNDLMARYESAMWKSTSGQYEVAAQELEKLTKDDPDWLEPHVELATLYYKLHRPEDGAKERAIVDQIMAKQQAGGPKGTTP
jgi:tetratricopeptide (TPR) repeat protein